MQEAVAQDLKSKPGKNGRKNSGDVSKVNINENFKKYNVKGNSKTAQSKNLNNTQNKTGISYKTKKESSLLQNMDKP